MLKKHPKGLMVLFFTEMWERFAFYTMLAVFFLYMDEVMGWSDHFKGQIYGFYMGFVYFTPIAGGWIADRFLGYRRTIITGAVVFGTGYALLALSGPSLVWLFFVGLIVVILGNGMFKANISVLVGNLYEEGSELKDAGYLIFYMGINVGAAIAPISATVLHEVFGNYNAAFASAAVGMLFSLIIFELGKKRYLYAEGRTEKEAVAIPTEEQEQAIPPDKKSQAVPEKASEKERILALIIIFGIVIFFWMSFHQNGAALTAFAQRSVVTLEWLKPETYQVFNPLFIILLAPVVMGFFERLRKKGKEPSTPAKIGMGMFISGIAMLVMVTASAMGGNGDANNMSPLWLIMTYFIITNGELLLSPMGLSFVSKVAPVRMRGLMMGGWFGATAVGNYLSGFLSSFYSDFPHHQFFLVLTCLLFFSALLVRIFLGKLKHATRGT